jgi:trigger factor
VIASKDVERLEHSSVKLTVTVAQPDVQQEYDDLIKNYSKTVQLKGFRKGKVPAAVLERKFGESLRAEAAQSIIEKSLREAIEEVDEKPLAYSMPALEDEVSLSLDEDFTFSVVYDVYPEINLGEYTGLEIEEPQVEVTEADLNRELEQIQDQNAIVMDKTEGAVEKDDIVTVDYVELDEEGNEVADTAREGFVFTVGTGYNLYKMDDDVVGMAVDEEKVIEKDFPEDFDIESLQGLHKRIKVKVTAVKQKELPEIDDELAQDISDEYETLEDLKKSIRERLSNQAASRVREMKIEGLMNQIRDNTTIDVPESMIRAELQSSWQNFVSRFQAEESQVLAMLEAQGRTRDELFDEWRPSVEQNVRTQLIVEELLEKEDIEAADDEIDEEIKRQAEGSNLSFEDAKEHLEKNNLIDYIKRDIRTRKMFDHLLEQSKVKKGEKVELLEVLGRNG